MLLEHIGLAVEKEVDQIMWKLAHYRFIERYRRRLRKVCVMIKWFLMRPTFDQCAIVCARKTAGDGSCRTDSRSVVGDALNAMLTESSRFYADLLQVRTF